MILVGNTGLSYQQWQAQMAMWAMMAAPLFLSEDLRTVSPEARALIQNPGVIAINQDPLGIMGKRIWQHGQIEAWIRPVTPVGSYAAAVLNLNIGGAQTALNLTLASLGVKGQDAYNVTEVFSGKPLGKVTATQNLPISVDTNSVFLLKYTKLSVLKKYGKKPFFKVVKTN
ncbi:alpha-N-acetylgalactosaminidase-like [Elysia marginata]|uniref:alpha-galactosidase n=1 Tax=Elysia marginata TaxID=1093978 RepID=A0AAV4FI62_9GAST|nr:alpha-N-acetylgalactosaminidase-like [Elysia marginata]